MSRELNSRDYISPVFELVPSSFLFYQNRCRHRLSSNLPFWCVRKGFIRRFNAFFSSSTSKSFQGDGRYFFFPTCFMEGPVVPEVHLLPSFTAVLRDVYLSVSWHCLPGFAAQSLREATGQPLVLQSREKGSHLIFSELVHSQFSVWPWTVNSVSPLLVHEGDQWFLPLSLNG